MDLIRLIERETQEKVCYVFPGVCVCKLNMIITHLFYGYMVLCYVGSVMYYIISSVCSCITVHRCLEFHQWFHRIACLSRIITYK